jgi:hypothetical protein
MWTYRAFRFPWTTSQFAVSPDTVDFGPIADGSASQRLVTVRNRSAQPLTITCFESTDSTVRLLSSLPFTIAGGDTTDLLVEATGAGFGNHSGALYVRSGNDTSFVAQAVGFKSNVTAPAPAASPLLGGLLGALLAAFGAAMLRRRSQDSDG